VARKNSRTSPNAKAACHSAAIDAGRSLVGISGPPDRPARPAQEDAFDDPVASDSVSAETEPINREKEEEEEEMSRIRFVRARMTAIVVIAAFAAGTLFGPSAATAAQSLSAFITNTPANPVPVLLVAVSPTVNLASGATSIPAGEIATIVNDVDVSAYKTIRLTLDYNTAQCTEQQVLISLDGLSSPESFAYPNCGLVASILIDTPGKVLNVRWYNRDPDHYVNVYWNLVGRH
jgi:hypothetical protein